LGRRQERTVVCWGDAALRDGHDEIWERGGEAVGEGGREMAQWGVDAEGKCNSAL